MKYCIIKQAITLKSYRGGVYVGSNNRNCIDFHCREGQYGNLGSRLERQTFSLCLWCKHLLIKHIKYIYFFLFLFLENACDINSFLVQGVFSSGIGYYLSGVVLKEKGPVFVTAFSPLSLIVVAILSSFIFSEQRRVGK